MQERRNTGLEHQREEMESGDARLCILVGAKTRKTIFAVVVAVERTNPCGQQVQVLFEAIGASSETRLDEDPNHL